MIRAYPSNEQLETGPVTIRALRSLTKSHVDAVTRMVAALQAEWAIDLHDDYEGYLSIIIQPVDHSAPTFLISGTTDRVELATLDGDDRVRSQGSFPTIEAAAAELATLLSDGR